MIYGLVDPRHPHLIRYVGKTHKPVQRLLGHIHSPQGEMVAEWIGMLRAADRLPDMVLLEEVAIGGFARERYWYDRLSVGNCLLNGNAPKRCRDFPNDRRRISAADQRRIDREDASRETGDYWREVGRYVASRGSEGVSPEVLEELRVLQSPARGDRR